MRARCKFFSLSPSKNYRTEIEVEIYGYCLLEKETKRNKRMNDQKRVAAIPCSNLGGENRMMNGEIIERRRKKWLQQ